MARVTIERIVASTACPAFATDGKGQILGLNGSAEALLGYGSASVRGSRCREVFAGRDQFNNLFCLERCALREMVARGEPVNPFELSLKTASGTRLEVSMSVVAVSASNGGRDAMLHLFRPVQRFAEEMGRNGDSHPVARDLNASANGGPVPNGTRCNGLTPREHEILALLASGKSCHDIARAMGIGLVTVRNQLKRIFPKLHVHSQAEAVSFAFRNKLI
jgi:PAS domain S-box-containing protein